MDGFVLLADPPELTLLPRVVPHTAPLHLHPATADDLIFQPGLSGSQIKSLPSASSSQRHVLGKVKPVGGGEEMEGAGDGEEAKQPKASCSPGVGEWGGV